MRKSECSKQKLRGPPRPRNGGISRFQRCLKTALRQPIEYGKRLKWFGQPSGCSRNHACAGSVVTRGCQAVNYGKVLISRGGSTTRIRAIGAVICANLRGAARINRCER